MCVRLCVCACEYGICAYMWLELGLEGQGEGLRSRPGHVDGEATFPNLGVLEELVLSGTCQALGIYGEIWKAG